MERITDLFNAFIDKNELSKASDEVQKIISSAYNKKQQTEAIKALLSCTDFTTLESTDSRETIWALGEKLNKMADGNPILPNIASFCTYPKLIATAREALMNDEIKLCSVAGSFPSGQTFTEIKIAEAALALADGADEIDMVMNIGDFLNEDYEEVITDIEEVKSACRDKTLKVIIETGALGGNENVAKASVIALYSGADFIKTSTGKIYPGASYEAFYIMCLMVRKYREKHGKKPGVKVAGGIKTVDEAVNYYKIVETLLGKEWLTKDLFRIGTSRLLGLFAEALEE
jgi:deoxyribose-phosphate aldolase